MAVPTCDLYLRLSDARLEDAMSGREAKLRAFAAAIGWNVFRVVTENDVYPDGRLKPASAYKRRKIMTPSGRVEYRVVRPGFREVLDDITTGRVNALLGEDLDRIVRDPRDMEDLLDACALTEASARSISGSLKLTDGGDENERYVARILVAGASKSSGDTSRRVKDDRERRHGQSFQGGRRPYGYAHATNTEKYHRTLIVVDDEAEQLRRWADDILERDISLAAIARELREQRIPTASGTAKWQAATVRSALLKPTIAGLAVLNGSLKAAPWPAILDPSKWEKLKAKLEDPNRRSSPGNEPKWLLSGIAKCGICNDGTTVKATGCDAHGSGPGYVCSKRSHLRRSTRYADQRIEQTIVGYLDECGQHILKPPVRKDIDTTALESEKRELHKRKAAQISLHSAGDIDNDDLKRGMREIRDRLTIVESQLRECDEPDPLAEFRAGKPAQAVWNSLSLPRRRAIAKLLMDVTFNRTTYRGPGFDPDSVNVAWKTETE